jgi:hypothetical protein
MPMGRYRIDELKSGDVSQLICLLGKIGFSPSEGVKMNLLEVPARTGFEFQQKRKASCCNSSKVLPLLLG